MKIVGIIPARFGSTRFPGKPLAMIEDKSMIQRVVEQVLKSKFVQTAVVATDDERIAQQVQDFGGEVVMTLDTHQSGTDRCYEALQKLAPGFNGVINIQGDEPFISPKQIDQVAQLLMDGAEIATLVKPISESSTLLDPNKVKAVLDNKNNALYFSRSPIPFLKAKDAHEWVNEHQYYKHLGIYGYQKSVLRNITHLPVSPLEKAESLEQLRWLQNGYNISTGITKHESPSIDTPADLEQVIKLLESGQLS